MFHLKGFISIICTDRQKDYGDKVDNHNNMLGYGQPI